MKTPTHSYRKVNYELRPAKQVERRMMIDAFQILAKGGFPIRDYHYIGFGSIYFVDFILLHKMLGIRKMINVEHDLAAQSRFEFNRPFGDNVITMEFCSVSDVLAKLNRDIKYLVWLDYDSGLDSDIATDVRSAATILSPGSILIVTVESVPPKSVARTPRDVFEHFRGEIPRYVDPRWSSRDFTKANFPSTAVKMLEKCVTAGLYGREEVYMQWLFNFMYEDGKKMLTVGGMIGTNVEKAQINGCDFTHSTYIRRELCDAPYRIAVPRLSRKERMYLDSFMPSDPLWRPSKFSLSNEELAAYREIYRFLPSYAELLLG